MHAWACIWCLVSWACQDVSSCNACCEHEVGADALETYWCALSAIVGSFDCSCSGLLPTVLSSILTGLVFKRRGRL